ncbi:unnamed protein product, partial [Nesidiocoris tenuis]
APFGCFREGCRAAGALPRRSLAEPPPSAPSSSSPQQFHPRIRTGHVSCWKIRTRHLVSFFA